METFAFIPALLADADAATPENVQKAFVALALVVIICLAYAVIRKLGGK